MYRGRGSSSSRGSWRGGGLGGLSRGGRGSSSDNWRKRNSGNDSTDRTPRADFNDPPRGRLITEITLDGTSTHDIQMQDARIRECRYIASYSLVDSQRSEIIIPGQPATWKPPQLPAQLPGDHGDYLRDQNGARFPDRPMQPSVQSLFALNKEFDPSNVDVMGCASSLGDILRFVRSVEASFRFDVEIIGNTLFLARNCRDEVIPDVRGFGHSFLDNFTSYQFGTEETKSHQRIVSYTFGGLRCLVRFECDGHFDTAAKSIEPDISDLSQTKLSDPIPSKPAGIAIPQDSILEIKTRSQAGAPIDMSEHLPRLWLRQIPNLIAAYHTRGNFEDVQEKHVAEDLVNWEIKHCRELRKFAAVLHQLIVEVKRSSHLKLELCRTGSGPLELREQGGKAREVLPADWKYLWARQHPGWKTTGGRLIDEDDDDDDDSYPRVTPRKDEDSESEDSDDNFSLDYTACDALCGYCGHCA
ncbi:uncharacterized protein F4822DRAFT_431091 [Hypoxylon trugodes]|uniref:uncharacterized protein n=1 Tax=Hypoxylon trugodes TaxID=326681 RepID=UPI00219CE414|nr:uncharacterized protein F4822DRAFT_431091 [Hypoxylon trugodes]KAI1386219.1 hypothetical protein F4822DRAFT_431091 [Hypoxylon trugodes]